MYYDRTWNAASMQEFIEMVDENIRWCKPHPRTYQSALIERIRAPGLLPHVKNIPK